MQLFHGTTLNKFLKAISDGYLGTKESIWDVSEPFTTYFHAEDFFKEEFSNEYWYQEALRYALESSDISLASERKRLRRIVLVLNSEDLEKIGKLKKDTSTSLGDESDYYQFNGKIPLSLIKEIWIDKEDRDLFLMYYIGLANSFNIRTYKPYYVIGFDKNIAYEVLEASNKVYNSLNEWYMENLDYSEAIEETTIEKLKQLYLEKEG